MSREIIKLPFLTLACPGLRRESDSAQGRPSISAHRVYRKNGTNNSENERKDEFKDALTISQVLECWDGHGRLRGSGHKWKAPSCGGRLGQERIGLKSRAFVGHGCVVVMASSNMMLGRSTTQAMPIRSAVLNEKGNKGIGYQSSLSLYCLTRNVLLFGD